MTLDDLDLMDATTTATLNVSTKRCRRHDWSEFVEFPNAPVHWCRRCGKVRDEAVVRRNRNNRQRGSAFERSVAKKLGGRRTGPLGGRDDVIVGQFAAVQTKKTARLSLNEARTYLDDLARSFPDRVPLVVHAEPGRDRDSVVILPLAVWVSLHGEEK